MAVRKVPSPLSMFERITGVCPAESIRQVGYAVVVRHGLSSDGVETFLVACVLYGIASAEARHVLIVIMCAEVDAQSQDFSMVGAHGHTFLPDGTDDVVVYVAHWHHALIDLDAVGEARRYVVDAETGCRALHGHAVDEELHVLAGEAVEIDARAGPQSAVLAHLHARHAVEDVRQVKIGIAQLSGLVELVTLNT